MDALIHLAAVAGVRQHEPLELLLYTNTLGALNMLEYCARKGVKKFVLALPAACMETKARPARRKRAHNHPLAPYAASKEARRHSLTRTTTCMG